MNMLNSMMLALFTISNSAYSIIQIVLFAAMVLSAVFVIVVILFQPGNTQGVGAVQGAAETFFGKNKSKSMEGKLKRLTVIALVVIIACSILFFLVASEILLGVGQGGVIS